MMKKFAILFMSFVFLSGCASQTIKVRTTAPVQTKPELGINSPRPAKLKKLKWVVVTEKNAHEVFAKHGGVLLALTPSGYKVMRENDAELLRLIKQQRAVILAAKKYYE